MFNHAMKFGAPAMGDEGIVGKTFMLNLHVLITRWAQDNLKVASAWPSTGPLALPSMAQGSQWHLSSLPRMCAAQPLDGPVSHVDHHHVTQAL